MSSRRHTSSRRTTRETGALKASDFLTTAQRQLPSGRGRPLESDLRRSLSTVYYALFHCLAGCCADTLIGKTERKAESWRRTYRALNHGEARKACRRSSELRAFPQEARDFARLFVDLQDERHEADYDPGWRCFKSDIENRIGDAGSAISDFEALGTRVRRAFAAHVLFKRRS